MRRTIVLFTTMALTVLVASGVALAVTKIGTNGPDTLKGTNGADNLLGKGGNDVLYAVGGMDNLVGGEGKDWVLGGDETRPWRRQEPDREVPRKRRPFRWHRLRHCVRRFGQRLCPWR